MTRPDPVIERSESNPRQRLDSRVGRRSRRTSPTDFEIFRRRCAREYSTIYGRTNRYKTLLSYLD